MSQENQMLGYGYIDDTDDSLQPKAGGVFGLNAGTATLQKFSFREASPAVAASEGVPEKKEVSESIEVEVLVGDKVFKDWINPITKVFGKNNAELTDKTSAEYINNYNAAMKQQGAIVTHYLKSVGVPEATIKATLTATPITSFADYGRRVTGMIPVNASTVALDVFLEYQYNIADGQDRTWLTLPKNMKGGYFITQAQPGKWTEQRVDGTLKYVNESGATHPFDRDKNFMESNKAKQQGAGADATTTNNPMAGGSNAAPAPSTW